MLLEVEASHPVSIQLNPEGAHITGPKELKNFLDPGPLLTYSLPLARFKTISLPVTQVVLHSVGKSRVLVRVSAYPKPSMGGIQPLAYSRAKHALSILYCLTVPRRRWCTLPWGYTSGS
jgi:hypothetical protein